MRSGHRRGAILMAGLAILLGGPGQAMAQKGKTDPTAGRPISIVTLNSSGLPVIQLVREDGSGAVTVNSDRDLLTSWPRWSPDGTKLGGYFKNLLDSAGNVVDTGLMEMAAGGSSQRVVISGAGFALYNATRPGVRNPSLPVYHSPARRNFADWVGNGALVFGGYLEYDSSFFGETDPSFDTSGLRLFLVDAGGNITPLTETRIQYAPSYQDFAPDWSPARDMVVFLSNRTGYDELYAIRTDGTGLVQITDFRGYGPRLGRLGLRLNQPRWSPDGTRIALTALEQSEDDLWILDVDLTKPLPGLGPDGRVRRLHLFKTQDVDDSTKQMASWSPTGDRIIFQRSRYFRPRFSQIVIADALTGAETVIVESKQQGLGYPDWKPVP